GQVKLWDLNTSAEVATFREQEGQVRWLGFHPDGRSLAIGVNSEAAPVVVRDWANRRVRHRLEMPTSGRISGAWGADGLVVFAASARAGVVRAWDVSGEAPRSADLPAAPAGVPWLCSVALTPEGRHLIASHPRGPALVFRLAPRGRPFEVPAGHS